MPRNNDNTVDMTKAKGFSNVSDWIHIPPGIDPDAHGKKLRKQTDRRRLWYKRNLYYTNKGWPLSLSTFFARFRRNTPFCRRLVREIDKALEAKRNEYRESGYGEDRTYSETEKWAGRQIDRMRNSGEFDELVQELFDEYDLYLEKENGKTARRAWRTVNFFSKGTQK